MASQNGSQTLDENANASRVPSLHRPIKGPRQANHRSLVSRDLACILEVDAAVTSWLVGGPELQLSKDRHVPDFTMFEASGTSWLLDAPDRKLVDIDELDRAAEDAGFRYRVVTHPELYAGFRLKNASDLLRYGSQRVPLGDRVRLLAFLDESGSLSFGECLQIIREMQPIAALASMIVEGLLEIDLDEALIGPETLVKRMRS